MKGERGQTALDFAVAMGVFLLAVGFVLAFIPTMFAPFFGLGVGNELTADRAASTIVEAELPAAEDGAVPEEELAEFFEDCTAETLSEMVGAQRAEIRLEVRDGEHQLVEVEGEVEGDKVTLECGDEPAGAETVSQRLIRVGDEVHRLRVVVW